MDFEALEAKIKSILEGLNEDEIEELVYQLAKNYIFIPYCYPKWALEEIAEREFSQEEFKKLLERLNEAVGETDFLFEPFEDVIQSEIEDLFP